MKQKILKLIKILNKFTIDDILSMDDFKEQEVPKKNIFIFQMEKQKRRPQTDYIV